MKSNLKHHIVETAERVFNLPQGSVSTRAVNTRSTAVLGNARAAVVGVIRDLYASDKPAFSSITPYVALTTAGVQNSYMRFRKRMQDSKAFQQAVTVIVKSAVAFDKQSAGGTTGQGQPQPVVSAKN